MENIFLETGKQSTGYDLFTWSDNSRAEPADSIVGIPLTTEVLSGLNNAIWNYYTAAIKENAHYFTEMEYPFPAGHQAIADNPYLLNAYFEQSDLWADFIMETLSALQHWDNKYPDYHLLKFKEVLLHTGVWYLVFEAIHSARIKHAPDLSRM